MSILSFLRFLLPAAVLTVGTGMVCAQGEQDEVRLAMDAALERAAQLESENTHLRGANAALAKSLAAANEDSRASREELRRMRADLEALGIAVFDPTDREARKRLIAAMAEAGRERQARERVEQQLLQFSESMVLMLDRLPEMDATLRADIESEIRAADLALARTHRNEQAAPKADAVPLTSAQVVSINRDLGLVVLNVGTRSGVRLGMPLEIHRQDLDLGYGLVADVRDGVCGVVASQTGFKIENLKVGDQARPRIQ